MLNSTRRSQSRDDRHTLGMAHPRQLADDLRPASQLSAQYLTIDPTLGPPCHQTRVSRAGRSVSGSGLEPAALLSVMDVADELTMNAVTSKLDPDSPDARA